VADTGNHTIRAIDLATGNVTTLTGVAGQSGDIDGPLGTAMFDGPQGLALDAESRLLYVADTLNRAIRRIDLAKGTVTTLSYTGPASLDGPSGLALDGLHLFVADADDDVVVEIDLQKAQISLVAGQVDTPGTEDGVGAQAAFDTPTGVALDGIGNLYVTDNQASTVRRLVLASSQVSTIAGSPNVVMYADGVGQSAYFSKPFAATANSLGDLFVSDTNNNAVRHVDLVDGAVTTVIGSPDLPGVRLGVLPAQLALPSAVALTPSGSLLVVSENAVLIAHGP
jgi:streptogramin lyase